MMKVVICLKGFVSLFGDLTNGKPTPINKMVADGVKALEHNNKETIIMYDDGHSETIQNKYIVSIYVER